MTKQDALHKLEQALALLVEVEQANIEGDFQWDGEPVECAQSSVGSAINQLEGSSEDEDEEGELEDSEDE